MDYRLKRIAERLFYMKRYEEIPHTADLAMRIYGKDIFELFENAAHAMFTLIGNIKDVPSEQTVKIIVEVPDKESLLISWLNELLYEAYSKHLIFSSFKIFDIWNNKLTAEVSGQDLEKNKDRIEKEIKAATYHDLEIKKTNVGYEVTIVFDV